ncbi:8763_t:CDS:1, partial [Rhizophagus irregularis]
QEKALYFPSASMGHRHKRSKRSFNSCIKKGLRGQRRWAICLYEVQEANN